MEVKKIFTKRIACELIKNGHELIRVEDNLKHKHLKVFVFEKTNDLLKDLTMLSNKK